MANNLLILTLGLLVASTLANANYPSISQQGCLKYANNLYCEQCDQSNLYYQVGNGCVRFSGKACVSIDYLGNCINCQQGFYLSYGNTCMLVNYIVGCTSYGTDTATTVCRACASGYILTQNRCLQSVPNCSQYIDGTNICAQCAAGYFQSQDWCSCSLGAIQNCIQYDCQGLCVQCNASFPRLAVNRQSCLSFIVYCSVYNPQGNGCQVCDTSYVLSTDSLACFRGIPFCATHVSTPSSGTLLCQTCLVNYYLSTNQTKCTGRIPNCLTYDTSNLKCSVCAAGFFVADDGLWCFDAIPNCVKYQPTNFEIWLSHCLVCSNGYLPDSTWRTCVATCPNGQAVCQATNTCVAIPSCCLFHDGCGQCLTTKPGTLFCEKQRCVTIDPACPNNFDSCGNCFCANLNQSWCKKTSQCVNVPSCCNSHDGCGNCVTLNSGFLFCAATNQCVAIPNCATYDSCGKCTCTQPGFTLCATSNTCVQAPICCPNSNNGCGQCSLPLNLIAGYSICASTGLCTLLNTSCPNNNDGCGNCVCSGANQNWCQSQLRCVTNPGCPSGSTYNGCGSCVCPNNGIYCATSNRCVVPLSCCATSDSCGNCLTWNAGFSLCGPQGTCFLAPAACPNSFSCQTGLCLCTGSQTYCTSSQSCVNVPACCATNNGCGTCLTTLQGTVFLNGQCFNQVNIPFCATYTANLQLCQTCIQTYILSFNQGACFAPILFCTSYAAVTAASTSATCLACQSPYFLSGNLCTIPRCNVENRTSNSLTCTTCLYPTVVNTARTVCGIAIQFCSTYNFALPIGNNCAACVVPYQVTTSNLCSTANYLVLQYTTSSNLLTAGSSIYAIRLIDQILVWVAYNSQFSSSVYGSSFEVSAISNSNTFSIRVLVSSVLPGNSQATLNYYYLTAGSNNSVSAQLYQTQNNLNVAVLAQQWIFTSDATNANGVNIQSALNNLYLGFNLSLSNNPVNFLLASP